MNKAARWLCQEAVCHAACMQALPWRITRFCFFFSSFFYWSMQEIFLNLSNTLHTCSSYKKSNHWLRTRSILTFFRDLLFWVKIKINRACTHSFVVLCRSLSPSAATGRVGECQGCRIPDNSGEMYKWASWSLLEVSYLCSDIPLLLCTLYYLQFWIELNTAHVKDRGNTVMWDAQIHSIGSEGTTSAFLHFHHWLTVRAERV